MTSSPTMHGAFYRDAQQTRPRRGPGQDSANRQANYQAVGEAGMKL